MALAQQNPEPYDEDADDEFRPWRPRVINGDGLGDGKPNGNLHSLPPPAGAQPSLGSAELNARESQSEASHSGDMLPDDGRARVTPDVAAAEAAGIPYRPTDPLGPTGRLGGWLVARRKKALIGGGIGGGIIALLFAAFLVLVPLKMDNIIQNLENHFYATAQNAMQKEEDNLLKKYLKSYVGPALKNCSGSTIDKDCHVRIKGTNPITNLYSAWANDRLEQKLAQQGLEISYNKQQDTYRIRAPGLSPEGENIGTGEIDDSLLGNEMDRTEARQVIHNFMKTKTKWYQVTLRLKIGRLAEEKYGVKRCLVACGTRDALTGVKSQLTNTAKYFIAERVLKPLSEQDGLIAMCVFDPTTCNPDDYNTDNQPTNADGNDTAAQNGEPTSQALSDIQNEGVTLAAQEGGAVTEEAVAKTVKDLEEKGLSSLIVKAAVTKMLAAMGVQGAEAAGDVAGDAVPVIGQLNMAAQLVGVSANAGDKVKKLDYAVETAAAARLFMAYSTQTGEMHAGKETAAEVGSFVNSLGPGTFGPHQKGGTAGAESTPLYSTLIDNKPISNGSASSYTCSGGKPVPNGKLVCNSEVLGQGNTILNGLSATFNQGCVGPSINLGFIDLPGTGALPNSPCQLKEFAVVWNSTIGWLYSKFANIPISLLASAASHIPCSGIEGKIASFVVGPYCQVKSAAAKVGTFVMQEFVNYFVPTPFGANMSGGRKFDLMAAGADSVGSSFAHNGLGGKQLSQEAANAQIAEVQNENKQAFQDEPFFARMFDTSSQYSLVSQMALAMPTSASDMAQTSFASIVSNPFGTLFNSISSIFKPSGSASAATLPSDPFGIPQYGYPDNDPVFTQDPETYWNQNCTNDSKTQAWNNAAEGNVNDIGVPTNTSTDGCLLLQSTVEAAGGALDTSLLSPDDLADINGSGTNSGGPTTTNNGVSIPAGTVLWPFATKSPSQYQRIDQGWDIQDKAGAPVYAIASGTLNVFKSDCGGFGNDYPVEKLDTALSDPPNSPAGSGDWAYYGHVHILPSLIGQHVNAGQEIATTNTADGGSNCTSAQSQNGSAAPAGWLEIGFAEPGTDAPAIIGSEGSATAAGQAMHDLLINAKTASGAGQ